MRTLLTLLRMGFTKPPQSPAALVVSYTTVSPLPRRAESKDPAWRGGLLSVALSRGSPRVDVIDHPALWSPDLPHQAVTAQRDFGYQRVRYNSATPTKSGTGGRLLRPTATQSSRMRIVTHSTLLSFRLSGLFKTERLAHRLDSLVRVSRRVA